jgi:Epoxide hydrolase N terminus
MVHQTNTDTLIHPFRLEVPQSDLDDLHDRLRRTRWPDQPPEVGWSYGVALDYLQDLAAYWQIRAPTAATRPTPSTSSLRRYPASGSPVSPARPGGASRGSRARGPS